MKDINSQPAAMAASMQAASFNKRSQDKEDKVKPSAQDAQDKFVPRAQDKVPLVQDKVVDPKLPPLLGEKLVSTIDIVDIAIKRSLKTISQPLYNAAAHYENSKKLVKGQKGQKGNRKGFYLCSICKVPKKGHDCPHSRHSNSKPKINKRSPPDRVRGSYTCNRCGLPKRVGLHYYFQNQI